MGDSSCRVNINRGMTNARLLDMGKVSDHPEPQAGEVFGRRCDGAGGELIDLARMEHAFNEETGSRRVLCISHRRSVAQSRRCRIIPVPYLLWTLHGGPRSASVPACSNYSWFELLLELSIATLQGGTHVNVSVEVNGTTYSADIEPRLLLVHYLRENCGLTGTNVGCDTSSCGACTIHLNGEAVKSCTVLAVQADGQQVKTIEGLADADGTLHPMQQAFHENHALQCGYCTPGMVMASVSLLDEIPNPTERQVREGLEGNLCRCTGYHNIVKAVLAAASAK